jgi:hypothetical protein
MFTTFNRFHLGDNLIHLNYLRRLAMQHERERFLHFCNRVHIGELVEAIFDVPNLQLSPLEHTPEGAVDAWIGADNYYYKSPIANDWIAFHLDWFEHLSRRLGLANPIKSERDLLFDYPALQAYSTDPFDFLIVNAKPLSNQFPEFSPESFADLVQGLVRRRYKVMTTHPTGFCPATVESNLSITGIGGISRFAKHIVSIMTGPMWPTFNVFATPQTRVVMHSHEELIATNTYNFKTFDEAVRFIWERDEHLSSHDAPAGAVVSVDGLRKR